MFLESRLVNLEEGEELSRLDKLRGKVSQGVQNWLIDTSAKTAVLGPVMGIMEYCVGLEAPEVLASRGKAAFLDVFLARFYGKVADSFAKMADVDIKDASLKSWLLDASAMILTHSPVYAGILYSSGADVKEIGSALGFGALFGLALSKPFRKYCVAPWRDFCNYSDSSESLYEIFAPEVVKDELKLDYFDLNF